MKKAFLSVSILLITVANLKAQKCPPAHHWVDFVNSVFSGVRIYAVVNDFSFVGGMDHVLYGTKNFNSYKVHISFVKVVTTTCGNVLRANADTYLKPGEFIGSGTFAEEPTYETQVWPSDCDSKYVKIKWVNFEHVVVEKVVE